MKDNKKLARDIAASLLQINAIKLNVKNPFTWASGIVSPIYCDNRQILSYPDLRSKIADSMTDIVRHGYPKCDVIAGVATGAIAIGALVADRLNKPFVYVRPAPKGHGLQNKIEGNLQSGSQVVVIEDLVSTGKSSLEAVAELRLRGGNVMGMLSIFSYEFDQARIAMEKNACPLISLSNYSTLIVQAVEDGIVSTKELAILHAWRENPYTYTYGKLQE